jgi:uncharacterized protein YkwD
MKRGALGNPAKARARIGLAVAALSAWGAAGACSLLPTLGLAPAPTRSLGPTRTELLPVALTIVAQVNHDRGLLSLPPLATSDALTDIAFTRAEDMLARAYLGHQDPIDASVPAWTMLTGAGYGGLLGENVLEYRGTLGDLAATTLHAWVTSREERDLLLDARFRFTGLGITGDGSTWKVAQVFAESGP